jgi:HEAT repeat protein
MQYIWLEPASASNSRAWVFRHDLDAFHKMGPDAVPYLLTRLQDRRGDSSPSYQRFYARMPVWGRRYLSPPRNAEQVRRTGELILKQLGPDAYPAVPELIGMLKKGDPREQHEAVNILKEIGLSASNALPALGGILRGNNPYLRVVAADAIRHINPSGTEEMLQVYREALQTKDKAVQMAAIGSFWEATRQPELVIPALTSMLGDPVSGTFACTILKQCGPNASNAVPALLLQLAAPSLELRVAAAAALTYVDPHAETRTVEATLAAGKAAGLWIYGLEYDAPGH